MRTGSDRIILRFSALISAGTEKTFIFATIKLLFRKHRKQHHRIAPTDWRIIHFLRHKTMKLHYFRTIYSASVISTRFPTFFPCFTKTEIASLRAADFKSSHSISILRTASRYDKKVFRLKARPYTGSVRDSAHDGHRFRLRLKTDNDLTGIYYFPSVKTDRCVLFNCMYSSILLPYPAPTPLCLQSLKPIRKSCKSRHTHFQRYSEPVSLSLLNRSPTISTRHRMRFTSFTLASGKAAIRTRLRSSFYKIPTTPFVRHWNTNRYLRAQRVILYTTRVALLLLVTLTAYDTPSGGILLLATRKRSGQELCLPI